MPPGRPVIRRQDSAFGWTWGENHQLAVTVAAVPAATYQWYAQCYVYFYGQWFVSTVRVPQQNSAVLSFLTPVTTNYNANYFLVASNAFGVVTSAVVAVIVDTAPKIDAAIEAYGGAGGQARFAPQVFGQPPLALQWSFAGMALPNATNASLTLSNLTAVQAGTYTLQASNATGVALANVTLNVLDPIRLWLYPDPGSVRVYISGSVWMTVDLQSSGDLRNWECAGSALLFGQVWFVETFTSSSKFFRASYPILRSP